MGGLGEGQHSQAAPIMTESWCMLHGFVMRKSWPGPLAAVLILYERSEFVRGQGEMQTLSRVGLAVCTR